MPKQRMVHLALTMIWVCYPTGGFFNPKLVLSFLTNRKISALLRSFGMSMIRVVFSLCVVSAAALPAAALQETTEAPLKAHLVSGAVHQYKVFPGTAMKLLFPGGDAAIDRDTTAPAPAGLFSKKVEFVKVSDPERRFTITGVVYENQLFLFDELFCGENPGVMSRLMRATGTAPKNPDQGIALVKLYLSLSYYGLRDPGQFVVSSVDDVPKEPVSMPDETLNDIRQDLHAPRVVPFGSDYHVELFTTDLDRPRVHRWGMKIGAGGLQDVTDQRVYPHSHEMRDLYTRTKSNTALGTEEKIELRHCCFMANGRTDDGAETSYAMWAASNGPFVSRTIYYYDAGEKAGKLMQRFLKDAVAVIEDGPWLDSEDKTAGRHALVILAGPDHTLSAAQLFEEGSRLLEFSSPCLRSILALEMTPPEGKGTTDSLLATLDCPDRVNAVAFSVDGKQIAAGYGWRDEGGLRVWNVSDRRVVRSWVSTKTPDSGDMITRIAFSPDGKLLAAATSEGQVLLFDTGTWGEPKKIAVQAGTSSGLSFSPQSDMLAFSTQRSVILCEIKSAKVTQLLASQNVLDRFIEAGFLPDGKTLAICDLAKLEFWDIVAGKSTSSFATSDPNFFCNLSPSGRYILTGGGAVYGQKLVQVRKVSESQAPAEISGFRKGLFASAMAHSEELMAFGGGDYGSGGDLFLWKTGDTQESGHVTTGKFPIESVAFSPDDSLLAAASHDGAVFLYSVERLRTAQGTPSHH